MAKTRLRMNGRSHGKSRIASSVVLEKLRWTNAKGSRGVPAFQACIQIGTKHGALAVIDCGSFERNPRKAIASALRRSASKIGKRSGAFAGLKRKSKRRRRR